jgi:proteasome inhibitor subunit 1 (PI31)
MKLKNSIFQDGKTLKTVGLVFKTKEVVKSKTGIGLDDYVNDSQSIINRMTEEIVKPLTDPEPAAAAASNSERPRNTDPLLVRPPRPLGPPLFDPRADPLYGIGRGDLDPFGRGGGMIFDPLFRPNFNPMNPNNP